MGSDQLRELGEDIKKNGMTAPVIAFRNGQRCSFLDGRNRLDGMELVGFDVAAMLQEWERDLKDRHHLKVRYVAIDDDSTLVSQTIDDPYSYVVSANIHRRHLTTTQKGELIEKLLKAKPDESDRAIAKAAESDHKTVAVKRQKLEATGEIPQLEKRTGADGKARAQPRAERRQTVSKTISESKPGAGLDDLGTTEPGSQPPPSVPTTPNGNDPTVSFRVPRSPKKLAKILFDKLTANECREVADSLYDHLGISRSTAEPAPTN